MISYLLVLLVGLGAGLISGVVGTGSSILLLPILVYTYGPKQAVPIMAVAAVMVNAAKMAAWWREVDWRAFLAYSITGLPAAAIGARTLLAMPPRLIDAVLGLFFILMVPGRRWLAARNFRFRLWHLALAGAMIGFLTGIVVSTGPLSVPAFLAFGLVKGAFIATEAASSLAVFISKAATFRQFGALPMDAIFHGLVIGSALMAGTFAAKAIVVRINPETFRRLLDGVMLVAGASLLWAAVKADEPAPVQTSYVPLVASTDSYPWSAVGRLEREDDGECTAAVVGRRLVLTAAHCLWNGHTGSWREPRSLRFVSGWSQKGPLVDVRGTEISVGPAYNPMPDGGTATSVDDWGLVILEREVASLTGVFGIATFDEYSLAGLLHERTFFWMAGQERGRQLADGIPMWRIDTGCTIKGFFTGLELLAHQCKTVPGFSGAPIFYQDGQYFRILAVHVARTEPDGGGLGIAIPSSAFVAAVVRLGP